MQLSQYADSLCGVLVVVVVYLESPDAGRVEEEGVGLADLPHVPHVPDVEGVVVVHHRHPGVLLVIAVRV